MSATEATQDGHGSRMHAGHLNAAGGGDAGEAALIVANGFQEERSQPPAKIKGSPSSQNARIFDAEVAESIRKD